VSLVALGYPAQDAPTPSKKPLKELIHWEKF